MRAPVLAPEHVLEVVRSSRLVSVIRAATPEAALGAARAVARGGVRLVEVTYSVPEAPAVMRRLADEAIPGVVVGAGTVLTRAEAEAAVDAGADFLIAPNASEAVAAVARERGVFWCPGAYTTSEILNAMAMGAHLVKLYPVGVAGGPDYVRIIRDPLPRVPLLAAGGTHLENVTPFWSAGCLACGIGAAMADPTLAMAGRFDDIEARARAFVQRAAAFATGA